MAVSVAEKPVIPLSARAFILAVVAGGSAVVALRLMHSGSFGAHDLVFLAAVAVAVTVADQFTLTLPHGDDFEHFALTDAIWAFAIVSARPGVPTLGVVAGTLAWQLASRWPVQKVLFNAGQVALGLGAAEAVYGVSAGTPEAGAVTTWLLLAAAMAASFAINTCAVALVIALAQGEPFRRVLLGPWRVNVLHWLGNVTVGLLAAIVWRESHVGVLLLGIPLALLYLAYRGWLTSVVERDQMEEMTLAAEAIALEGSLSSRLPVGEQGSRLPALAASLNRMLDQLQRALQRERHFMQEAASQLRAPIAAIGRELAGPEVSHDAIRGAAASVSRVLDDMSVFARGAGPGFVRLQPVLLAAFVRDVAGRAPSSLGGRLRTEPAPNGTTARIDAERMSQALLHLLQNAAVHAAGEGEVVLRVVDEPEATRFEVTDHGGGVPAGHEGAIFEPFYRATDGGAGAGLGLALVRTVAEAHGGSTGVVNKPGRGVTFWIRIPS